LKSSKANCLAFFVVGVLVPHYVPPSRTAATPESIFTPNYNSTKGCFAYFGFLREGRRIKRKHVFFLPAAPEQGNPNLLDQVRASLCEAR